MLGEVAGKDTRTVVIALIKRAKKRPKELHKSLLGPELTIIVALRWRPKST
jgi:hypothetical protein